MKQFLVSAGIKMGISLVVSAALKAVIEEGDSKSQLIANAIMGIGACVAGCIVTDKIVEKLYEDEQQSNKNLREILDSYFIKRRIKMTGWILFTAVISLVIGIVLGWILCTWALANYIIRNGTLLKKEEKDGGLQKART